MTGEEKNTIDDFLINVADCTNKINYVAEQAEVMEENLIKAIRIIKDYNDKIISFADKFNEWLIEQSKKGKEA